MKVILNKIQEVTKCNKNKMDIEKRKAEILKRFGKMQESKSLVIGRLRSSFGVGSIVNTAREIIRSHLKEGITKVPISYKEYATDLNCDQISDINHFRDKMTRIFEVATVIELGLVKPEEFKGLYKSENTKLIRSNLDRTKNFKIMTNSSDKKDIFLTIDVTNLK